MKRHCFLAFVIWTSVLSATSASGQSQSLVKPDGRSVHQFDGIRIARVEVEGNKRISTEDLIGQLKYTQVGVPFSVMRAVKDVEALANLYHHRGFANAQVQGPRITPTVDGITVAITVEEGRQYRLGMVSVAGAKTISAEDIEALVGAKLGEVIWDHQLYAWEDRVRQLYDNRRYVGTEIVPRLEYCDPPGTDNGLRYFTLRIVEGKHFDNKTIKEIDFTGNEKVSTPELLGALKDKVGDQVSIERLRIDAAQLSGDLYGARGYIRTTFENPVIEPVEDGVKVTLRVHEGRQYSVRSVTIEDNTAVSTSEIAGILNWQPGEIVRWSKITDGTNALTKLYRSLGYAEFSADASVDWHDEAGSNLGVVDLDFKMQEGQQYRIHGIRFRGAALVSEERLTAIAGMKAGDIFNQQHIDQSLEALNHLGLFETVRLNDVTIDRNDREAEVDIVYVLKAKAKAR